MSGSIPEITPLPGIENLLGDQEYQELRDQMLQGPGLTKEMLAEPPIAMSENLSRLHMLLFMKKYHELIYGKRD
jgi:hypothetical protein